MRNVPSDITAPIKNLQARYLNEEDDRLKLIQLDVSDEASIKSAAAEVAKIKPDGIDYLINNAGECDSMLMMQSCIHMECVHSHWQLISFNPCCSIAVQSTLMGQLR